ncbi:MAG: hypothetical protein DM484_29100 [Candidatus Methylumidiphilus alinenensis]|uniref:AMP-dependent synthetase/ligase domain-containing protein n=1 Tax=Candidatus Methylumidiphilus alinenensis TaxID=2202197 RepID=A0A2W4QBU9_9GAMM|nr:MAG: hypothetical protein DM484_29100 [Candidatus Methylumidiphilus alinenensis]
MAVSFQGLQLTYREVNLQANRLAHCLQSKGVGPNTLVGLSVPRCADFVIGILAILKAGGAYLPLDPSLSGRPPGVYGPGCETGPFACHP